MDAATATAVAHANIVAYRAFLPIVIVAVVGGSDGINFAEIKW